MDFELGEDSLGVVPRCMLADLELASNRLVGAALAQQFGHLSLAPGQAELSAQIGLSSGVPVGRALKPMLLLEAAAVFPELVDRASKLGHQIPVVTTQS